MQKNWYIVYTKPRYEKKVAALLTKKKIDSFCPLNCKQIEHFRKSKLLFEPLFSSYVFAFTDETSISLIRQVENVVSLVYWKSSPAVITSEEIESIKEFTSNYRNIKLERSDIIESGKTKVIDWPMYSIDGKILMIKSKTFKVHLPSLGFTMIAEIKGDGILDRKVSFGNKELFLQS